METELNNCLNLFRKTSLKALEKIDLMERTDIKFVFPASLLPKILEPLAGEFLILEIGETSMLQYNTIYFDTPDFRMYLDHHNGSLPRYKVRRRRYSGTGQIFLEVKKKSNKGVMKKRRIEISALTGPFSPQEEVFIRANTPFLPSALSSVVSSSYKRITVISDSGREKCTFDTSISFNNGENSANLDNYVIGEFKSTSPKINLLLERCV